MALATGNVVGTATELTVDTLMSLYNLSQQQQENDGDDNDEYEQQEEEEQEIPSGSTDQPTFMRERSRSHDSDLDLGERLLHRGASRSRSSTPDRGYPKKKYQYY